MKIAWIVGALALTLSGGAARAEPADPMVGLFAQDVALANDFAVAESTIVVEDSTNPALKSFAEQMVSEHTASQRALRMAGHLAGVPTGFMLDAVRQKKVDDIGLMDGAKLDAAYIADQMDAQAAVVASLQAYAASGSNPALVEYARLTLPIILTHQRMLERITGQPKIM